MEAIRVLIFNWRCWLNPAMGGAEVFIYEVAKEWMELTITEANVIMVAMDNLCFIDEQSERY
jgi:hypothetical protein